MALSGLEKNEEALGALERALRINPDYIDAKKARASINSKLGIDLDEDEEEKTEKEKPKVKKSVWTMKKPTSEIMKKYPGQGREKRGKGSEKSVWAGKEQKTGESNKSVARGREKKR
jgi:tetratricopeptide (TPR) repeat protein